MQSLLVAQMPTAVVNENYFDIIIKGGWILIPIAFLSLIAIFVIVDRYIVLHKAASEDERVIAQVKDYILNGKTDSALATCERSNQPIGMVVAEGIRSMDYSIEDIREAMEGKSREVLNMLETRMNILSLVASIAPMLGFLGTIMGVIKIFYTISLTDNLSIGSISDGLYQKMICSAAGLLVGIVAFIGYQLLNGRIDKIAAKMEKQGNDFIFFLKRGK
ncbi:MotA/TolQ/ExbB proton channel family protein [Alistipes sp. ZOR0009]|jgi:biopolymer transport protein ExbB|uniref:MotA/TolQ/ExbB proton channel family protein n=1 Tax=Alistipes sp. ZOR0009 TaxID=1339253 RepID=UPI00068DE611|nr:MotA/TolQ/ExbB proton channel family protein [Alistipes sp. ZOR0009]